MNSNSNYLEEFMSTYENWENFPPTDLFKISEFEKLVERESQRYRQVDEIVHLKKDLCNMYEHLMYQQHCTEYWRKMYLNLATPSYKTIQETPENFWRKKYVDLLIEHKKLKGEEYIDPYKQKTVLS